MRLQYRIAICFFFAAAVFAQSDRGTITGTVVDQTDAAVPGAAVTAKSSQTGLTYQTTTTVTGNYTLASLQAGSYELSIEAAGFKRLTQTGLTVQVAQTVRVDATLQIGASAESVTVDAVAPLLKTESAEQSTTVSRESLYKLPLNFSAAQGGAIRNPLAFATLAPGVYFVPGSQNTIKVNGSPGTRFKIMIDGQDATPSNAVETTNHNQPSLEAMEEFTLQASNFAAEFGQALGGLFNFTARSGTDQFHGSAYDYIVNEALNAGQPFTDGGGGRLFRPRARKHDFGGTVGGPLVIPRLYNGRNKTFVFFNIETFVDRKVRYSLATVPTAAMRDGDFSAILTGRRLAADPLGRPIMENSIYDPATLRVVEGQRVRDTFPNNVMPKSRFDPVSAKIQAMMPAPTYSGLVNNWDNKGPGDRTQIIPSVKLDHNLRGSSKLSFYFQYYRGREYNTGGIDGLPNPITANRAKRIYAFTTRLNYDVSITPTLLLHAGVGDQRFVNRDVSPQAVMEYDAVKELGLVGSATDPAGFPTITGMGASAGGMGLPMGPSSASIAPTQKPTAVLSATLIRNAHTYKAGGEFRIDAYSYINLKVQGTYNFAATQTGLPSTQGQNLGGGSVGFPYASFLLGAVNSASVSNIQDPQFRKTSWSLFVQDTWKVTRKLTLDYGLRWDLEGQGREIRSRMSEFSPTTRNPSAGGLPGATIYEGYGPGRCNCTFAQRYPYAFGPRLGVGLQIDSKTVLRAAWGIAYGPTAPYSYFGSTILGVGYNGLSFTSSSFGDPALLFRDGMRYDRASLYLVSLDPGIRPTPGQVDSPPTWIDRNAGRPPRLMQWNIGLQRQLARDLMVEAAYVGNRGVWQQADGLLNLNGLTPERITSAGLDINSAADRTLLTSRLDSAAARARGFTALYSNYPVSATVAQTLRPFPQFGNISTVWAPVGSNWYDALQAKATQRFSHGLTYTAAFTWQKELVLGAEGGAVNDVYNRKNQKRISPTSLPFVFVTALSYQVPTWGSNRWARAVVRDWVVGGLLRYASGLPIAVPSAQNALSSLLFRGTFANRVPGEPLFLKSLNDRNFDPNRDFVLNPKAWSDPAPGQWGTAAAYYNDYRSFRRPEESLSLGRILRIREKKSIEIRAEFFNPFNRTYPNSPDSGNALATQRLDASGKVISGFGRIDTGTTDRDPRNGQLVVRFQW